VSRCCPNPSENFSDFSAFYSHFLAASSIYYKALKSFS
jgi:hypothetical protein